MSRLRTALLLVALGLAPVALVAQAQDTLAPAVRFRLPGLGRGLPSHPALMPGGRLAPRISSALVVARWRAETQRLIAERAASRRSRLVLASFEGRPLPAGEPVVGLPPVDTTLGVPPALEGIAQYADLTVELNARLGARVDRLQNLNCTAADVTNLASGCQGGFPTPELDQDWQLRAGGVIADRLHLNVDFDSDREFSANNTINLWYQGFEDEVVRRVEVGNLDFQLPSSRFITSAIPANSFGLQADAQLGPLEFRAILAQQKGSSVRSRVFNVGDQALQTIERESRDVDFEFGRFFFVVDPTALPDYPAIDVLNIEPALLPPQLRPTQVRVYRLRAQTGQLGSNPNLGGINAVALRDDSPQRVGPFQWELLVEGVDYYLDRSGAWFALRNRISTEEYLAVSYVNAAADTVGTFPSIDGAGDTLRLIHEPRRGPGVPTFRHEMRNIYRVGGSEVSRNTVSLALSVNDSERPLNGVGSYLSALEISLSTDPRQLDEFNRVFPRERDPNGGQPIRDRFLVFPHLTPFADSSRLQAGEIADSLYRIPTYLLATEGPASIFRLQWRYEASGSGDRSQLSLGAIQVRAGSETISVGGRDLVRDRDYEISYDLGLVTFTNPDSLFRGPTQVRVEFEENQLFDTAPKNVLGLATTYNLGSRGRIDVIGLFQRERTVFTRPRLGFEPQAMFMGGLSADLEFQAPWLTRAVDGLPLLRSNVPSVLEINGEVALSRPNPNQAGEAYIEEFEGQSSRSIPMGQANFQLGSRPLSGRGLPASHVSPVGEFDPLDAVPLVWQNSVEVPAGAFEIGPQEIDSSIVLTGSSQLIEPVLWLTLQPDTVGGAPDPTSGRPRWIRPHTAGPRWRSLSHPLDRSGLGVDLSRTEFLEFWLLEDFSRSARRQGEILVFDFGTVLEDAVAFGPDGFRVQGADTVFSGFQLLGEGTLDSEKDPVTNVFNAAVHDLGVHGDLVPSILNLTNGTTVSDLPLCEQGFSTSLPVFPLGDLSARCTRRNGVVDSEDLNGDNRLDINLGPEREDLLRYVVPVGDPRFVVRTGRTLTDIDDRTWTWRLYRVPFRGDTLQLGEPDLRQMRSLRVTVVAPDVPIEEEVTVALARMRLVGAPWIKRAETPIRGFGGSSGEPHGEVIASIISTENQDLGYTSPPGVGDEAERRGQQLELGVQEINERSLRLIARDLRLDERAEAFIRFADEADKNFLKYRKLRVWARGRGAGWEEDDLQFFIKVGRDEDNFYLFRTAVRSADWEPEVVVDLERWLALRAEIEAAWLRGEPPSGSSVCGGDPEAFVACEDEYLVQVKDPGVSPPNLARVSEVAAGIYRVRETMAIAEAELWVDDVRLADVVGDVGLAGAFEARLNAADFAEFNLAFTGTDDRFRTMEETPDYQADRATRFGSTVRMDKFFPSAWGLNIPVSVEHQRSATDPFYVRRSDVLASALPSLREPKSTVTSYQVAFRRTKRGAGLAERLLLDPVSVDAARLDAEETTELSSATTENRRVRFEYDNRPGALSVPAAPDFLIDVLDHLPGFIKNSEFGRALRTSRLRLNPQQIRVASTLTDNETERSTFRVPVELPDDANLTPLKSVVHTWRNELGIDVRPFSSLGLRVDYITTRDLQDYGDSTSVGRLIESERSSMFGRDVGFERDRIVETNFTVSPVLNSWLRPRLVINTEYVFRRDPNARTPVEATDGALRVPDAVSNRRRQEMGSSVDLARMVSSWAGQTSPFTSLVRGILPADVSFIRDRGSTFDRIPFTPDFRYQLGLGSVDEFRVRDGVLATSAVNSGTWTAAGGTRLPLGLTVRVRYRDLEANTWARRGDAQAQIDQRSTEWPSGFISWVYNPRWKLNALVSTITAQAQYRNVESSSFQPAELTASGSAPTAPDGRRGILAENNRRSITPSVTFTWVGGVVTSAQYSADRSEVVTSGNVTRSEQTGWGGTVSFTLRPPRNLIQLPGDLRTEVAVNASDVFMCLQRVGSEVCSPVSDSRRRQVDLRLDTAFPPNMRGGASFSYVLTDQRHTSNKFSQLIFSIFLDINFLASQVR